uniref:ribosome modulation factor n=1 Tax=Pseudomonas sp. TMP25 TaxID=3136561 RepID=UPI0040475947
MPIQPNKRPEYKEGRTARTLGQSRWACPYSTLDLHRRCLWMGGWGDADMEQTA